MILLERIDLAGRRAEYRVLGCHDAMGREVFARASALARQLGLDDVRLLDERSGAPTLRGTSGQGVDAVLAAAPTPGARDNREASPEPAANAVAVAVSATRTDSAKLAPSPRHRWEIVAGVAECELVFEHEPTSRDLVALWVPLVLACSGAPEDRLVQLHTGLYEICANILEHGRLRHEPGMFTIVLRFHADRIEGYVQDCCERFDSALPPLQGVLERVGTRARRGFGIHMMLRLIDHLQHEYNETGNRLVFTKGILP